MRLERARLAGAYLLGLGATAAVLSPLVTGASDSFPISTYPMFARPRGKPVLHAVIGVADDGREAPLPAALVASGEVLQTKVMIARSVEAGLPAMAELCRSVATRVGQSEAHRSLRHVELVRRRYDPIAYFETGPEPIEEERLFRCAVPADPNRPGALGAGQER